MDCIKELDTVKRCFKIRKSSARLRVCEGATMVASGQAGPHRASPPPKFAPTERDRQCVPCMASWRHDPHGDCVDEE